ncbi:MULTISPECIES: subunit of meta cleavage enzyme [Rhizobium]|uniref:Protocatechuate 4,5-dioxygenase alpha chain n=1 Tax=Rhizobium tropici TaxID=398 RepID=A0A6P1C9J4_RHITR|nr:MULTISPECIES: subunit of meta cleavage enzyme [Rhizobium]AGB74402.1 putative subunit of meta cleavage enzyme [Rhizobium tropici CIAT 899]MBB4240884.1 protocatechuate 4,5-dioxygenase alpha chain [Rhizobium tropici]MBB5591700.1 protocatechuate 4,5-dioxygenase alpha chain [Rhizobium tropici]MBB6490753.1 protocatechuate 4,5-dioxygenase alpha chain [Rhizobium tropici]NEV12233.1 subunit of meta cleavage enzyme [Rhizobium tropici]
MSNWRLMMPTTEAYLLDKVLFELHHKPDDLAAYNQDKDQYLSRYKLTAEMKAKISGNDVAALYEAGVNPYLLRAHCIGVKIPEDVSLAALRSLMKEGDDKWLK